MHDPLNRLYRTKVAFLAVVFLMAGLALISFAHWASRTPSWRWLDGWPLQDVGIGLFTTGLLGVALQYFVDEDKEQHDLERQKRLLTQTVPAMRDAVIEGFAFEPDDLARVATPAVLDQIVRNGLAIRLGDASFAADLYSDLKQQAIDMPERLHDCRVDIHLARLPLPKSGAGTDEPLLEVIARWEFRVVPVYPVRRFVCLSDPKEFQEVDQDGATSAWSFLPKAGLTADDPEAFELVEFTVNGEHRDIHRSAKPATAFRPGSQTYTVSVGQDAVDAGVPVTMTYTYRTVTALGGHRLRLRVDQPTHGLTAAVDYSDAGLDDVVVLDYIASSGKTAVARSSAELSTKTVVVEFDGWALPRSGLAVVWP